MTASSIESAFVAGATGFVGRHLLPALRGADLRVVAGSRSPEKAKEASPELEWRKADVQDEDSLVRAMEGCDVAYHLVHEMSAGGDYPARERRGAEAFRRAAARAGVKRVVYLGGVMPPRNASKHLQSRARTGQILREGEVEAIELRAAMIIGHGSESWTMVRDLAGRLPAMVLPSWTQNHSWPVGIEDVAGALLASALLPSGDSRIYDVPGPERLTHQEMLDRVAQKLRRSDIPAMRVPVLTPRLSSYWVALVTNVDLSMAKELVEGIVEDLDPSHTTIWTETNTTPRRLEEAIDAALRDERAYGSAMRPGRLERLWRLVERVRPRGANV